MLGNNLAVADSVISTIPMVDTSFYNTPGQPGSSAASTHTNTIYIAVARIPHLGSPPFSWVAVINGSTNSVISEIPLAGRHAGIAVNPDTNMIYADDANGIEVIDGTSNSIVNTI